MSSIDQAIAVLANVVYCYVWACNVLDRKYKVEP